MIELRYQSNLSEACFRTAYQELRYSTVVKNTA